jgi:hypothetical protein
MFNVTFDDDGAYLDSLRRERTLPERTDRLTVTQIRIGLQGSLQKIMMMTTTTTTDDDDDSLVLKMMMMMMTTTAVVALAFLSLISYLTTAISVSPVQPQQILMPRS